MPASIEGVIDLATPLAELTAIGKSGGNLDHKALEALRTLKLVTVDDLLRHFPRRHEDRTRFDWFPDSPTDTPVCLRGLVTDTQVRFVPGRRRFFEAAIEKPGGDALGGKIVLRWFNMPYIHKLIAVGQELVLFGQPKERGRRLVIDHPDYEIVEGHSDGVDIHMNRIAPVYPLSAGIGQRTLRTLVYRVLEAITDDDIPDRLPPETLTERAWFRARAIRTAHFPASFEELEKARLYLGLEEATMLQLELLKRRRSYDAAGGAAHCGPGLLLDRFLAQLPFAPTAAQRKTIAEIRGDLASTRPMCRLLQGDVGSGKTLVATAAMLLAVEAGFDAAMMAPTQILAEQHYRNLRAGLDALGICVKLRTGARSEDSGLPLFSPGADASGYGAIVVGTHALIHGAAPLFDKPLGLVVIDEQHKFGVAQRQALIDRGSRPDVLAMTATPIPRTLTLSVYGDLDLSILDELPAGRGPIVTGLRDTSKIEAATEFLRQQLETGRQAYLVYPLIDESEKVKSAAAAAEFGKWEKRLAGYRSALLHGRMSAEEKDSLMEAFRRGEIRVLVSTTLVEVGVDVANATVMIVFNAERFGLAQLHQLRGRIGRGEHKSYCILMADPENAEAIERLKILEETCDGFRIAEADLRIRGPGEVLGTMQSGLPDLKFPEFLSHSKMIRRAREIAGKMAAMASSDPGSADAAEGGGDGEVTGWSGVRPVGGRAGVADGPAGLAFEEGPVGVAERADAFALGLVDDGLREEPAAEPERHVD